MINNGILNFSFDISDFTEGDTHADFAEEVANIEREAEAYMEQQRAKGREVRFTTAVMELSAKRG